MVYGGHEMADDPTLYRQLGELTEAVRGLRDEVRRSGDHMTSRLDDIDVRLGELEQWRTTLKGMASGAKVIWGLAGTGVGGVAATVLASFAA